MVSTQYEEPAQYEAFSSVFEEIDSEKLIATADAGKNSPSFKEFCSSVRGMQLDTAEVIPSVDDRFLPVIAGGTAMIVGRTFIAPLERVQVLSQCSGSAKISLLGMARSVIARQGLMALWRGNLLSCARIFPFGGIVCLCYGKFVSWLPTCETWGKFEPFWRFMAGSAAGGLATLLTHPLDVLKERLAAAKKKRRHGVRGLIRDLIPGDPRALFAGARPSLLAMSAFVGAQQAAYDSLRIIYTDEQCLGQKPSVAMFLGCGLFAGAAAQTVLHPIDVVRKRMKNCGAPSPLAVAKAIARTEGPKAFAAGIAPAYLKVIPSVALSVAVRDTILGRL